MHSKIFRAVIVRSRYFPEVIAQASVPANAIQMKRQHIVQVTLRMQEVGTVHTIFIDIQVPHYLGK